MTANPPFTWMETLMRRVVHVLLLLIVLLLPASARAQTETVIYYHTDAIGSVRMTTDAAGQVLQRYDYLPFGDPWPSTPAQPEVRRFGGQELDSETQLNHFGARQYQPQTGRFSRADDPGYGNPFDPQSMNLYAYARNNPLSFVDPSGHDALCGPDTRAGECDGLIKFYVDALTRPWERVGPVVEKVREFVTAPRDAGCMSQTSGAYGAIGGMAGAAAGFGGGGAAGSVFGNLALPGGGTLGGGFGGAVLGSAAGGTLGALGGMAIGRAVGSVACMSSAGGGGGGGGGGNTAHGDGRLTERKFSPQEVAEAKTGRVMTQADGAKVYVKEVRPGRFNVVVEGSRGIITGMKNLDQRALSNLARNYGWQ